MTQQAESADPGTWSAESIRLTAFPLPGAAQLVPQDVWEQLVGEPPESIKSSPRRGQGIASGTWNIDSQPVYLKLMASATRTDVTLDPVIDPEVILDQSPSIGNFNSLMGAFRELGRRWLEFTPPIRRLAVAPTLVREVATIDEGYEVLKSTLPPGFDPAGFNEFSLRLNRKLASVVVSDLELNTIVKWSLRTVQEFQIQGDTGGRVVRRQARTLAHLELDINTDAEFESELPQPQLPDLLSELVDITMQAAQRGLNEDASD